MKHRLQRNPPWLDRVMQAYCEPLHAAAKRLKLPEPQYLKAGACQPAAELGCGLFGCAVASQNPAVIVKATRDENEAHFAAAALELTRRGVEPAGLVKFYGILATKFGFFLIWRERAEYLEEWWKPVVRWHTGHPLPEDEDKWSTEENALMDEVFEANRIIQDLSDWSEMVFSLTGLNATGAEYWRQAERARTIIGGTEARWEKARGRIEAAFERAHGNCVSFDDAEQVVCALLRAKAAALRLKGGVADKLGCAWLTYLEHGVVFDDLHQGNIGARMSGDKPHIVITDPGSVTILNPELANLPVEVLK